MQLKTPTFKDLSGFDNLNDIASGAGLLKLAKLRHPSHWEDQLTIAELIEAANSGDPYAQEVVSEAAQFFGEQLQSLIADHGLKDKVALSGTFCMNNCVNGVSVTLDGKLYSLSPETTKQFFETNVLGKAV